MNQNFTVFLDKEDSGYVVTVPSLPGCITQGDDINEAIAMAREAITLYIDELISRGEEYSNNNQTLTYSLNIDNAQG